MRVRSHQNPFSLFKEHSLLELSKLFPQPDNTLVVEIGSAGGFFLLNFCKKHANYNIIGIEIRKLLVESVLNAIQKDKLTNAHILHANANTSIPQLFKPGQVDNFFIFFPDPWIKKRHLKRRVVNAALVQDLYDIIKIGGEVFIQSDVLELAQDIQMYFENSKFTNLFGPKGWAPENHTGIITERESFCLEDNKPVHRLRYKKLH
ncbi:MAG: tRNA (guanosine(46)-N7)-methyltransferase TrmB [Candidatus Margulisiibacteriota bacterium]|nr:MAG: tRNA (guanosine(46)-N7)-methyltransferase TrmB [Candidatus Margulisbacteria bacterium GWD2_39_127]OGI02974.1 MAG: tRNA (guanosine(46)-N7)-methyltransferase TrmB [Candidatus Margulisbacteria bacterium GWF2_38_17]OGI09433.1 MAG: tRNA (guanosine(46)-N7)-methyltransferase TrmB [Candidatus Margulisbacteria bacterium GWE2_39_32]PZM78767.1 MAG: tRNA (guanosine(46)-N7)-methyltransferase TrmB [Candidatus Margulisiibacteriota bacterium]HAR63331.1 tRNA (guanosine(46)-N7)-methyltransferase TrmB [Ca